MMNFKTAFAAARKAGKKTFTWDGKSYNTKVATGNGTPAKAPVPKSRPVRLPATAPIPRPKPSGKEHKYPNANQEYMSNKKEGNYDAILSKLKKSSVPASSDAHKFAKDTVKKETVKKEVAKSKEPLLGKRVKYKRASWM